MKSDLALKQSDEVSHIRGLGRPAQVDSVPPLALRLPAGWRRVRLDEVTRRGSGHTPDQTKPQYWNGGVKWVSLADSWRLDRGYISATEKEISSEGLRNSSAVLHEPNTVILSRDAGVGKSAVLKSEMAVSQHFIAWECCEKAQVDPWFPYLWLQWHKAFFERMAVGSTIKTIGLPLFRRLTIDLPPLSEQRKIAAILRTWDEAIERGAALRANGLERRRWFRTHLISGKTRLPRFAQDWPEVRLGQVLTEHGLQGTGKEEVYSVS